MQQQFALGRPLTLDGEQFLMISCIFSRKGLDIISKIISCAKKVERRWQKCLMLQNMHKLMINTELIIRIIMQYYVLCSSATEHYPCWESRWCIGLTRANVKRREGPVHEGRHIRLGTIQSAAIWVQQRRSERTGNHLLVSQVCLCLCSLLLISDLLFVLSMHEIPNLSCLGYVWYFRSVAKLHAHCRLQHRHIATSQTSSTSIVTRVASNIYWLAARILRAQLA